MSSRIRQLPRSLGTSLAGEGMLVRLRRTSIALLGLVAGVGLGLIIFISQLGFPSVFSGPLPGTPTEAGTVHDAIALNQSAGGHRSPSPTQSPSLHRRSQTGGTGARHPRATRIDSGAGVGGSRHPSGHAAAPGSNPDVSQPVAGQSPTASPPTASQPGAPPVASPAPVTAVVETAKAGSDGHPQQSSSSKPKSDGPASTKATRDASGKPELTSVGTAKSQQGKSAADQTPSAAKPSSSSSSAKKVEADQSASAPKPAPSAPVGSPAKGTTESSSPAAAKEAADASQ